MAELVKNKLQAPPGKIIEYESIPALERYLLRLEAAVLVSALVLAAMVLYGTTRRPKGDRVLCSVMLAAYSLSYGVVAYAVGLIQEKLLGDDERFTVWVTALLLIQASAYAAPGQNRRDMDQRKKLLLHHILQTGLVLWLILSTSTAAGRNKSYPYRAAIWVFLGLNVLKTSAKIVEVFRARLPDPSVEVVAAYMDVEECLSPAGDGEQYHAKSMKGYKYLFHGEESMQLSQQGGRLSRDEVLVQSTSKSVATIDRVYRWIDAQGGGGGGLYSEVEKSKAKDLCLAFTLFKLLKRRFYGYVPEEAGSRKSLDLVLTGLIKYDDEEEEDSAAAYRVVQAELAFLYDFFYTRNNILAGARTHIFIAALVLGLSIWATFFGTGGVQLGRPPSYQNVNIGFRNLDRLVTLAIVVIIVALELCEALARRLYNNWDYVETVYRCVRDDRAWSKRHLWRKQSISPPETMYYWAEEIGGYVLLEGFSHRPWNMLSWLTLDVVTPLRQGQKISPRKKLPLEVRRAVLRSLKDSRGRLSNGVSTMRRHNLLPRLFWACQFAKVTDQILVWHVVTTHLDWASAAAAAAAAATTTGGDDVPSSSGSGSSRLVATTLSNYCAYLVAFVPNMLPDQSYNAEQIFGTAVRSAQVHFARCHTKADILVQLDIIEANYMDDRAGKSTIIERAALLSGMLKVCVPNNERRWEVLAEFWAEFILFLAPSDNVDVHVEMLGAGGEFMTQLWALLSHAGILERTPPAPPQAWISPDRSGGY